MDFPVQKINEHVFWAINRPWKGKGASSERCVYVTLCLISYFHRGFIVHASARDVSERTGLSKDTVSNTLHRLRDMGWITKVTPTTQRQNPSMLAYEYRIDKMIEYMQWENPATWDSECPITDHFRNDNFQFLDYIDWQMHDAFRRKGLGKSALEIYYYLNNNPGKRIVDIERSTGRSRTTIKRCITFMLEEIIDVPGGRTRPLISKRGALYFVLDENLSEIANILGVAGDGQRNANRNRVERERHRRWIVRLLQANGQDLPSYLGYIRLDQHQ